MDTEHILWIVLVSEYKIFNTGSSVTCAMNCNYCIATTVYKLETCYISSLYICEYPSKRRYNNNNNNKQSVVSKIKELLLLLTPTQFSAEDQTL
jgi:hypothetical protein